LLFNKFFDNLHKISLTAASVPASSGVTALTGIIGVVGFTAVVGVSAVAGVIVVTESKRIVCETCHFE
jgi:hypothetical protein